MKNKKRVASALLILRVTIFIVMFMWTLDKFVNPDHAIKVYEHFYFISSVSQHLMMIIASVEMLILVGFLFGVLKTYTYGAVLLFHAVSTLSSYQQYFNPFEGANLLFFAAWPMLGACLALFMLREMDTLSFGD